MEENTDIEITENPDVVETPDVTETADVTETKRKKAKRKIKEVEITVEDNTKEIEELKAQLEKMTEEKNLLENEKNTLSDKIKSLEEEVKITPQKLGKAIKEMGIEPLNLSRENPQAMSVEKYNNLSDSERREWQRSHRADYLKLMHKIKISSL